MKLREYEMQNEFTKRRGQFEKILAVDCETSGMNYDHDDVSVNYQSLSWGLVVSDITTFKPIDELYVEIKWNGKSRWEGKAERIHGMSREYLDKNGVTEEEAAEKIGIFIYEHFGIDTPIVLCGHNVQVFDRYFLKKLLHSHGLEFKFAHRGLDTFSLSMATVKEYNSDDLFEAVGLSKRGAHNALDDAKYALETYRRINKLWKKCVSGE